VINSDPVSTDDHLAIQRLVHRYADAVVHRDPVQWGSCWAADAAWVLGPGRTANGVDEIVAMWKAAMSGIDAVVQTVDNGDAWYTSADRSTAAGRWYITETFRRPTSSGILRAHYDDSYVQRDGGWRFANRALQIHYHGPADLSGTFMNTEEQLRARGVLDA